MFNLKGKLFKKFETKDVTATFKKREFVVEYADNPQYTQYILFQLVQDKCELLDSFEPGSMIDVSFNLRGREWTSPQGDVKYFNSLDAWRLSPVVEGSGSQGGAPVNTPSAEGLVDVSEMDPTDDLPF